MKSISAKTSLLIGRKAMVFAAAAAIAAGVWAAAPVHAAPPKGEGLDSLDDHVLGAELSSRNITNLRDRYFKINHISEADQQAMKTVGAFGELKKPNVPYGEKLRRAREVAEGIDAVLPTLKDPLQMMTTAQTIKDFGVDQDVNSLEYWGEDPVTQNHLKPLSSAVVKLLEAASKTAEARANELSKLDMNNKRIADEWERMDNMSHGADYAKNMAVYADCIATNPKVLVDAKTRKPLTPQEVEEAKKLKQGVSNLRLSMAKGAMLSLKDFDDPASGVQPRIRNMLAKLHMAAGEYTDARGLFASVAADKSDIMPPPNVFEQYEARYFGVVNEVLAGDLAAASKDKQEMDAWQTSAMPDKLKALNMTPASITDYNKGISAAGEMLQWRVFVLAGDLAKTDAAAKKKADADAETVLLRLKVARPDLAWRIDQQLVNRMAPDRKIDDTVPPSLLLALLTKGMNESYKADADKPDPVILKKGIESAQAIITRKDRTGLSEHNVTEAKLSIPVIQEKLGNQVEAINAYLDFAVTEQKAEKKQASDSFERAGYLIFQLNKLATKPAGFEAVYNKFLPIAINPPFNHIELAYLYADQLRATKDYELALKYYAMVPKDGPANPSARYMTMTCLDSMLEPDAPKKLDDATRAQDLKQLITAAEEVRTVYAAPKDNRERFRLIAAIQIIADSARKNLDPKGTLEALKGYDEVVEGLTVEGKSPKEKEALILQKQALQRSAKTIVIRANMQTGNIAAAVEEVKKLIANGQNTEVINLVSDLIKKLDDDYKAAKQKNDIAAMRVARAGGASLTSYLAQWSNPANGQKNPAIAAYYYAYTVYDARMQREAGMLATLGSPERKTLLEKAKTSYLQLQTKMKDLYLDQADVKAKIKEGSIDAADPDPQVSVGLALTAFQLGDYNLAHDLLLQLISNKKLGKAQIEEEGLLKPNQLFWEGWYAYIKSGYELNKKDSVVPMNLKNLLMERDAMPGDLRDEFEALRKEITPDFNPDAVTAPKAPAPAPAPAVVPAAVAAPASPAPAATPTAPAPAAAPAAPAPVAAPAKPK